MSQAIPTTSELIKKYGLNTKKSLGQNFILDKNFTDKIVALTGNLTNENVLEIGPGPGSLTRSILDHKINKLVVIEKDERCIKALEEIKKFHEAKIEIINDDALTIDETKIFPDQKFKIIANLPYNIGTVLVFKWLKIADKISSMHLMLQKEVVERIIAKPGSDHYGRLAVMINFLCTTKMVLEVSPKIFVPQPKVTSAIVEIIPRVKPLADVAVEKLELITRAAFNQRRKMLKSSLKSLFPDSENLLKSIAIDPQLRPENLAIEDFCQIAKKL